MTTLRIAPDLDLPLDLVTQKIAILARSGAGKTNTAVDVVEELLTFGQQVVILDPPGAWWGLRSSSDGRSAGYPVVVMGGLHGDVPLEPTAGSLAADVVVDHGMCAVLDLSEFTDSQVHTFVAAFAERLYARKNAARSPLMLVLEEADELAPQNIVKDSGAARMLHHVERIAKRGRMRGIGFLAISQRSAALNKHVLSQIEVLIALQTTAPQDIAAIDEWVKNHGDQERRKQLLAEIASLPIGTGFVWSPSWLGIFQRARFRRRRTFDSSATPEPGKERAGPRKRATIDVEGLRTLFAAAVERAEASDPKQLRAEIARLQRELAQRPAAEPIVREVPVLDERIMRLAREAEIARLRKQLAERPAAEPIVREVVREVVPAKLVDQLHETVRRLAAVGVAIADVERHVADIAATPASPPTPVAATRTSPPSSERARRQKEGLVRDEPAPWSPPANGEVKLKAGARRMVEVLAAFPGGLTRDQLSTLADVTRGGTFSEYLRSIEQAGLVMSIRDTVELTSAGLATTVGARPAPTTDEIVAMYRPKLKAGARRMLDVLLESYPDVVSTDGLSERADVTRGGTFSEYKRSLVRVGLADERDGGLVAGANLFLTPVK